MKKFASPIIHTATIAIACLSISSCLILDGSFHERKLTSFEFTTEANPGLRIARVASIDEEAGLIEVSLPDYLDLASLSPTFEFKGCEVSVGGVRQESGISSQDFSKPLVYSVLGYDDAVREYSMQVQVVPPSAEKNFVSFNLSESFGSYWLTFFSGKAPPDNHPIPYSGSYWNYARNLSNILVNFEADCWKVAVDGMELTPMSADRSNVECESNILDYSGTVSFVVTAEDGSTATYIFSFSCLPTFASFAFDPTENPGLGAPATGAIDAEAKTIRLAIPSTVSRSSLVARFSYEGDAVSVGEVGQESALTANDFTAEVPYTIHGRYGDATYRVLVESREPSSEKGLVSIMIGEVYEYSTAEISWRSYTNDLVHEFPSYSSIRLYRLYVSPTITGARISVTEGAESRQLSLDPTALHESNFVDFGKAVSFIVTAEDGSTVEYQASITKGAR